ncbi:molecular chaperone TorD family protein [Acidianus sp. HS-5]|uniref:TorD/DmsD family molecular chaperone n=1 Tax=Acidianus sp. HS-5 TaxID=2886040 RepID=UPI001F352743|nr:molecular chaperone TorD family protein [Acidianus sp. HS-5]BDC17272.1 component of anaerobic dehydrogenase [Acidianus sp. HS-5]
MKELSNRAFIYDIFSDIFYYKLDDDSYKEMLEKIKVAKEVFEPLSEVFELLNTKQKKDYLIEYTTLFLTGIGVKPLTPVESKRLYTLMGEKVALFKLNDIIKFYKAYKLRPKMGDFFQPEADHISSIMAFMSFLISKEDEGDQRAIMDERNFFISHVYGWIPDWANDVIVDDRSEIFKSVCKALNEWINVEKDRLGVSN